jgi:hypothetical protein
MPNPKTLRIRYEYDAAGIRPVSRKTVEMIPPTASAHRPTSEHQGFWYELQDASERTLYHRGIQNPVRSDVEVFTGEPGRTMHRKEVDAPRGTFELLVPDLPTAHSVVIFAEHPRKLLAAFQADRPVRHVLAEIPEK